MANRSDDSGRPAAGGTVGDDAFSQTMDVHAKTQVPQRTPTPPPTDAVPELRTVERSHYTSSVEIARGGLGRILRAQDRHLDRTVAIKEGLRGDEPATARFIREALVTARLQHPSIIPVYEAGRWPTGEPFYAMKLVTGRSLSSVIAETKTLEDRLAMLPNVIAVADAMAYAHSQRIIHRDLKPDNVLVGAFGETVVIDWGLAKDLSAKDTDEDIFESPYQIAAQGLTMAGAIMGTPEYMAPEQAQGKHVDERSDVYAIGTILYHVLVGEPPFRGESLDELMKKVVAAQPAALEERSPGIPQDLASVVRKAMARSPEDRYATAKELAEDLKRFQTGQLVSSKRYTAWSLLKRWILRHRTALSVAAAASVLLITIGVLAITNIVRERSKAQAARAAAEARTNQLILLQARSALDHDPAEALAWLKTYPLSAPNWAEVHEIASQAQALNPARHILVHPNAITIAFSNDGKQLASAGRDKTLHVWDVATGRPVKTVAIPSDVGAIRLGPSAIAFVDFAGTGIYLSTDAGVKRVASHKETIAAFELSRDGRLLAASGDKGSIVLVDTSTGQTRSLTGHNGAVLALAWSADGKQLASGSADHTVRIWEITTGRSTVLHGNDASVYGVGVSDDGRRIASIAFDRSVRVWTLGSTAPLVLRDGDTTRTSASSADVDTSVRFSPDGSRLVAYDDRDLTVWNLTNGQVARSMPSTVKVAMSTDASVALLAARDASVRVVDLAAGDERELGGQRSIVAVAMSSDGTRAAALGLDFKLRVWDVARGVARPLRGHTGELRNAAFSPDDAYVATASLDGTARVWSVKSGESRELRGHAAAIFDLAFSPDSAKLATAGFDQTARVWTLATTESKVLTGQGAPVFHPLFSPDGRVLYTIGTIGTNGTLRAWNLEDGTDRALDGFAQAFNVDLSHDGRLLVAGGADGDVRLCDVTMWNCRRLGNQTGGIAEVRFLPDGHHIVSRSSPSASSDRAVRLWDIGTGADRIITKAHGPIRALAISRDGAWIAAGGQDKVIDVVNLATGAIRTLHGHTDAVKTLRFSPDGRLLASGGFDNTVRLWDLTTGASAIVHRHDNVVWDVEFSSDGKLLASTSVDKTGWIGAVDSSLCLPNDPVRLLARINDLSTTRAQNDLH